MLTELPRRGYLTPARVDFYRLHLRVSAGGTLEKTPMNLKSAQLRKTSPGSRPWTIAASLAGVVVLGFGLGPAANPFHSHRQAVPSVISTALPTVATLNKPTPSEDPSWALLSLSQKQTLAPLKRVWPDMNDGTRQRWMGVASHFSSLTPQAQGRLRDRMVTWNQLTPTQRAHARLQYLRASKLSANQKWARWTAYQKLPVAARPQILAVASVRVISPASVSVGTGATSVPMTDLFGNPWMAKAATQPDSVGAQGAAQIRVDPPHSVSEITNSAPRVPPDETAFSSPPVLPDPLSRGPAAH